MSHVFVRTGIEFETCQQVLAHIGEEMLANGVVHPPTLPPFWKGR